jgi:hypothetical protein
MEVSGQIHTPVVLPLGRSPWYCFGTRLYGSQNRAGCCGDEKHLLPRLGSEPRAFSPWPVIRHYTDRVIPAPHLAQLREISILKYLLSVVYTKIYLLNSPRSRKLSIVGRLMAAVPSMPFVVQQYTLLSHADH